MRAVDRHPSRDFSRRKARGKVQETLGLSNAQNAPAEEKSTPARRRIGAKNPETRFDKSVRSTGKKEP
jgi:hypothetical protein